MIKDDIVFRFLVDVTESHHDSFYCDNNGFDLRLAHNETRSGYIG